MFKMGCSMAKKILAIDKNSNSSAQAGSSSAAAANTAPNMQPGTSKATSGDELGDFSKLEQDPRLPLNVRQVFKITKSWKAIARTMSKTGTAMFLNLFEQNQDLFYLFDRFQHLKGKELHDSMELREHASTVMSTLDQSINSLSDYDNFVTYLHSIGKLHRKVPGFKREHFWKIEQPFLKAVKQTLDERCNETIEEIYKIAIKLIIETIADGYGQDPIAEGNNNGTGGGRSGDAGESGASGAANYGGGSGSGTGGASGTKGSKSAAAAAAGATTVAGRTTTTNHGPSGVSRREQCREEQRQSASQTTTTTTLAAALSRQLSNGGVGGRSRQAAGAKCDEQSGKHGLTGESMMEMSSSGSSSPQERLLQQSDKLAGAQVQMQVECGSGEFAGTTTTSTTTTTTTTTTTGQQRRATDSQVTAPPAEATLGTLRELLAALIARRSTTAASTPTTHQPTATTTGRSLSSGRELLADRVGSEYATGGQLKLVDGGSLITRIQLPPLQVPNEPNSVKVGGGGAKLEVDAVEHTNGWPEAPEVSGKTAGERSLSQLRLHNDSPRRRQQLREEPVQRFSHLCERNKLIHLDSARRKGTSEEGRQFEGGDENESDRQNSQVLGLGRQDNEFAYAYAAEAALERPQSGFEGSNSNDSDIIDRQSHEIGRDSEQLAELLASKLSATKTVLAASMALPSSQQQQQRQRRRRREGQAFQPDSRPSDMAAAIHLTSLARHSAEAQCRLETSNGNMDFPRDAKCSSEEHMSSKVDGPQSKRQQQQQAAVSPLRKLKTLRTRLQFTKQSPLQPPTTTTNTPPTPSYHSAHLQRLLPNRKHDDNNEEFVLENKLPKGCSGQAILLSTATKTTNASQSRLKAVPADTLERCPIRAAQLQQQQHKPRRRHPLPPLTTDPGELVELIKMLLLTLASGRRQHQTGTSNGERPTVRCLDSKAININTTTDTGTLQIDGQLTSFVVE